MLLTGALILKSLDKIAEHKCAYVRYMDDWVILTKTKGQLRCVVKLCTSSDAEIEMQV